MGRAFARCFRPRARLRLRRRRHRRPRQSRWVLRQLSLMAATCGDAGTLAGGASLAGWIRPCICITGSRAAVWALRQLCRTACCGALADHLHLQEKLVTPVDCRNMLAPEWSPEVARAHFVGREVQLYGQQSPSFAPDGTTNKQDYPQHPLEARYQRPPAQYQGSGAAFDGTTTYGTQFHQMQLPEKQAARPPQVHNGGAAFDGTTTNGLAYVQHQLAPRVPCMPGRRENNNAPFDGTTSYGREFPAHPMPEKAAYGGTRTVQPSAPFDGTSTYSGQFVTHPIEARHQRAAAPPREALPFEGGTTYGDQFPAYPILPRERRAPNGVHNSSAKFEGTTTSMDTYKAWVIDTSSRRGPPPPMRPNLPFEGLTTSAEMFQGWQLPPKRPALGVQMLGDKCSVLIPAGAGVPAIGRQTFTTCHEAQAEISFLVIEGDFREASRCNVIGQFDMTGLPPAPAGVCKIEVCLHIDTNGVLSCTAVDTNSQRQEQWLREGYMVARV
ncbi:hypothetical protein FOA52_002807 [Chlamydomonas sp. UWO 241]|nr:hypothetical protein FOA52_002807 [Chlamydomonas sp. UWO 241]